MSKLITPSIVGAVEWLKTCPPDWKQKAREDLLNALGRVWKEEDSSKTSFVLGRKFEDMVYAYAQKDVDVGSEHFKWFVSKCRGGVFQKKSVRYVTIDGVEYCLYGKIDVWFPERIHDVKTTRRYKGQQGYLDSFQHVMYCYNENIMRGSYLIAEFEDKEDDPKILMHHEVPFEFRDRVELQEKVEGVVHEFAEYIKSDFTFSRLYETTFCRDNRRK